MWPESGGALGILSGQPVSKEPVLDLEVWPAGGVDQWLADEQGVECLESRCLPFDLVQLPAPTVVDKPDHVGFTYIRRQLGELVLGYEDNVGLDGVPAPREPETEVGCPVDHRDARRGRQGRLVQRIKLERILPTRTGDDIVDAGV